MASMKQHTVRVDENFRPFGPGDSYLRTESSNQLLPQGVTSISSATRVTQLVAATHLKVAATATRDAGYRLS
jgi:hypothetical protein